MVHQITPFLNTCYRHKYRQYSRSVWKGFNHWIQGANSNNERLKFQEYQKEGLEGHRLNIIGIKKSQTTNVIVEGI